MVASVAAAPSRLAIWVTALALPLALIVLLRSAPAIDREWDDQPAHFWIVLLAGVANAGLALAISEAGRRRRDARLLLIGLAFLASAGFLGLHALATPTVLLDGPNAGFTLATPVGLVVAGAFAAASAVEYELETSLRIVRRARWLGGLVLGLLVLWGAISVGRLPPLHDAVTPDQVQLWLGVFALAGVLLYAWAAFAYFRLWRRRRSQLLF